MKVLIINPPASYGLKCVREGRCEQRIESYQYIMVPISLPSIAALLLKNNHKVEIFDCIADNISMQELESKMLFENPDIIIVNVATVSYNTDILVAEMCSKLNIPCAAIGVHTSVLSEEVLKESKFNFIIRNEPELTCLKLVDALERKNNLKNVKGISYKKGRKIIHNPNRPFIEDLDSLPFPARHLLHNEKYKMPLFNRSYTLLISSRGCPHNCTFCTAHVYYGKVPRFRSIDNVIEEIKEIREIFKIKDIAMWSDTFTLNKKYVIGICNKIRQEKLDINWYCNSRVDTIDEEMIKAMSESNCKAMTFGVESLNQNILNVIKKNITFEQVSKAIKLCKKYKIESQAHIIFGLPGETKQTIKETIKKIKKINPDYIQFYCAVPFPGTELREYASKNNLITTNEWSKYELNQAIISYPNLSNKEIQKAMRIAYMNVYLNPQFIFRKAYRFPINEWPNILKQTISFMNSWVINKK